LIFLEPFHDLLARPMMIVVEVQDDGVERQPLVASLGTSATDVLQTVEQTLHPRSDGVSLVRIARQRVRAFVCRAEGAGAAGIGEILAERLPWTPPRAFGDRRGELELIFPRHLMHHDLQAPAAAHFTPRNARAHLFVLGRCPPLTGNSSYSRGPHAHPGSRLPPLACVSQSLGSFSSRRPPTVRTGVVCATGVM